MKVQRTRAGFTGSSSTAPHAGSHGRLLTVARTAWVVVTVLAVLLFVTGLPGLYEDYRTLSIYPPGERDATRENLAQLGFSLDFYAAYLLSMVVVLAAVWCTFGGLLFWRKSHDRMALFVALMFVLFGTTFASHIEGSEVLFLPSVADWLVNVLESLALGLLLVFFYLFPDGRFVPHWTRWLAVLFVTPLVLLSFLPSWISNIDEWPGLVYVLFYGSWFLTALFAQVYRYQRVSSPVERQQLKWVCFSFAAAFVVNLGATLLKVIFPSLQSGTLLHTVVTTATWLLFLLAPLSIGISILRYRLWDIDILINRTLVYGTLTATLALVYYVGVVFLQALLRGLTGQESSFAVAASTLTVAMLFMPLRRRIQTFIDKRFYRTKYDARKTLEAFGARVRDEVDLKKLSEALMEMVDETMKPSHASLWLKPPPKKNKPRVGRTSQNTNYPTLGE